MAISEIAPMSKFALGYQTSKIPPYTLFADLNTAAATSPTATSSKGSYVFLVKKSERPG